TSRDAPRRTAAATRLSCCRSTSVFTDPSPAPASIPAVRCISSSRAWFTWARKAGRARRRYTERSLRPALRAACSTVAPQANAITRASVVTGRGVRAMGATPPSRSGARGAGPTRRLGDSAAAGGLPRELFPAAHDHVTVQGVDLHHEGAAPALFGGDQGRAAA